MENVRETIKKLTGSQYCLIDLTNEALIEQRVHTKRMAYFTLYLTSYISTPCVFVRGKKTEENNDLFKSMTEICKEFGVYIQNDLE